MCMWKGICRRRSSFSCSGVLSWYLFWQPSCQFIHVQTSLLCQSEQSERMDSLSPKSFRRAYIHRACAHSYAKSLGGMQLTIA